MISTRSEKDSAPRIQLEKHRLANGLEVILSEDHRLPIVALNIWYHVGTANERAGRTGFAHLFEHMMFQGSKHVGNSPIKFLEAAGATDINGTTGFDRTNYFETLPSEKLELGLWFESDRMAFLLESLTARNLAMGSHADIESASLDARIQDLSDQLTQKSNVMDNEHQLLAAGRDITDLMGARNLHIVDVADTDAQGKKKPAFGRIFYTEGKSLIFYAYDLNETKLANASYQYRIWAKKEGQDAKVQHLGIFYADDKMQRRWAFKYNDPKVLKDIDSVFVTLEPAGSAPSRPKGQNLMYAYLLGQPNHP